MTFDRTGIILYTINYKKCIDFYSNILELKILFTTKTLTCFEFGGSYLMVEKDHKEATVNHHQRIKTCLRINVSDVKTYAQKLVSKGIKVDYQEHSWGTVAKFFDPDKNLCAFKDSDKFEKQLTAYNLAKK
ncbi:VOC family protein [Tenacibaculum sp. UWU-22]|uniref:VOC family protein n=1 Tax=Tenacibaculum sp. UWU-22 TaxID=3234187 RepID=UPI0034DB6202